MKRLNDPSEAFWRITIFGFLGIGIVLLAAGYLPFLSEDSQFLRIWGILSVLTAAVLLIAIRVEMRAKIIGPNESTEGTSVLLKVMKNARKLLYVIDPYPSEKLMRIISAAPKGITIRLLTTNLGYNKDVIRAFEAMVHNFKEGSPEFEVRYAPKGLLHDRFILTLPVGYHLGQSIKDFGNKHSRISELSMKETEGQITQFHEFWTQSKSPF